MNQVYGVETSPDDAALIALLESSDVVHGLEALFTPLQPTEPVEQLVRRT